MGDKPNMVALEGLRGKIGNHLADIAELLDPKYKLTFLARFPGDPAKTVIVTDDDLGLAVANELMRTEGLITVAAPSTTEGK